MIKPSSICTCRTCWVRALFSTPTAPRNAKGRRALGFLLVATSGALSACGGDPTEGTSPRPGAAPPTESESIQTVRSSLTATQVCDLVNALGTTLKTPPVSGIFTGSPPSISCDTDEINHTYYNGAQLLTNTLNDLFNLPYVTSGAYLCGIADADGASVDARLGGFGIQSQFNVTQRDPAHGHVAGRRVGTVSLFGIPAKLLVHDFEWTTLPEVSSNSIPPWWGAYAKLHSQGIRWDFDATLNFRIGALDISINPSLHSREPTVTRTNNAIGVDEPARRRVQLQYLARLSTKRVAVPAPSAQRRTRRLARARASLPVPGGHQQSKRPLLALL